MAEKLSSPEREPAREKSTSDLESLRRGPEKSHENKPGEDIEKRQEKARRTIEKSAEQLKPRASAEKGSTKSERRQDDQHFSKRERRVAFKKEIKRVQSQLPPASRALSKVVHNRAVESISEVLEETVLRPSVLIGGATVGLVGGTIFYIYARLAGFTLSGSEFLISMLAGALIGIVLEIIYKWFKH